MIVLVLGAALLPRAFGGHDADSFDYGSFLTKAAGGQIRTATFTNGTGHITGELTTGERFSVSGPSELPVEDRAALRAVELRFRTPT